ncbi:PhnD/SsuA/transferrin family substrate-binding protein [bacterium]|nr:PhnD/SsuA/transferrin family substrate-binding protein [bacterium]
MPQSLPLPNPATLLEEPAVPSGEGRPASVLPAVEPGRTFFRIGFLTPSGDNVVDQQWFQELKQALLEDGDFRRAMRAAGVQDISLRPCDASPDMLQRMLQSEFDLLFCPAMVYVQERVVRERLGESSQYRVLFQSRRGGTDRADSHSGGPVTHRGVLFANRRSPIGRGEGEPRLSEIKGALQAQPLAVSGSYDAAGFFYVRKLLWEEFSRTEPGEFLYTGSPQEVVKTVLCGLTDVGACEESVLREVLREVPGNEEGMLDLVRVLKTTKPVATDPVVIHERYDPSSGSTLGLAAAEVARQFYNFRKPEARGGPLLERGSDEAYDPMEEDLRLTRSYGW